METEIDIDDPIELQCPFGGILVAKIIEASAYSRSREIISAGFSYNDYFGRFREISYSALRMLERRSLEELRDSARQIREMADGYIDQYIEQETYAYILRLSEHSGWELNYLPEGSRGTFSEVEELIENWQSDWGRNDLPNREDCTTLEALIENHSCDKNELIRFGLVEPDEYEFFAVLALMTACDAVRSNQTNVAHEKIAISDEIIVSGRVMMQAMDALAWAEKIKLIKDINKITASGQSEILEAAIASRVSERASKAARKLHSKKNGARDFVASEWKIHCGSYEQNKSAFCRDYVRRVLNEHGVSITEKTMREVWLNGTPAASKQA